MSQANSSMDPAGRSADRRSAGRFLLRSLQRLLKGTSFWSAVVLPFVAVLLLVVQPAGWVPLLAGVFAANVLGALVGHCHGLEC